VLRPRINASRQAAAKIGGDVVMQTSVEASAPAEPMLEAKAQEHTRPATSTSVADTDDINAMTSAVGTPTEIATLGDFDVPMQPEVAVKTSRQRLRQQWNRRSRLPTRSSSQCSRRLPICRKCRGGRDRNDHGKKARRSTTALGRDNRASNWPRL
jgi:hypothetical protein